MESEKTGGRDRADGLKIIKASAGSGKTHRLTQEYISLLLPDDDSVPLERDAYRHILAVTFTNKATDEMKNRVIEYLKKISGETSPRGARAATVLSAILHDYSRFSVSTIDKFFQSTMRSFAREIGQFSSYRVELDTPAVLKQCIDTMMSSLEDPANRNLLEWLLEYSYSLIENGLKWDVSSELESMAGLFMREDFKILGRQLDRPLADRATLMAVRKELSHMMDEISSRLVDIGRRGCAIMDEHGLSPKDFSGGSRSPLNRFVSWRDGKSDAPTDTFTRLSASLEGWYSKSCKPKIKAEIENAYRDGLASLVDEAISFFENDRILYNSARYVRDNIFMAGIFSDLHTILQNYLKDNNMVLLSETADVLNRIIDGNDTPFVYEKTGTRYDHFMLDEFQDTSRLQWLNFLPLIKESISRGNSNLIVGDVKQSIYRWRGSDSKILAGEVAAAFDGGSVKEMPLSGNWRSCPVIVGFNNGFFSHCGELTAAADAQIGKEVGDVYSDSLQETSSGKEGGSVKVRFIDRSENQTQSWKEAALELVASSLPDLVLRYKLSDITFLVRRNDEGAMVAQKLLSLGYEVVTDDSLLISSSSCVMMTVSLLKREVNPDDEINNFMVSSLFGRDDAAVEDFCRGGEMSLYQKCVEIFANLPEGVPVEQTPFVNGFLDSVISYTSKYGSSIAGFIQWWECSGSLKSISSPEGENAIRIMTIHKAKGLKSECVIIPFLELSFKPSSSHPTFIWTRPLQHPFDRIGLVPVRCSKELEKTIFADDYRKENISRYIDNFNLAYVALTRAVSHMEIYAPLPAASANGQNSLSSVADVLYAYLEKQLDGEHTYSAGEMLPPMDGISESGQEASTGSNVSADAGVSIGAVASIGTGVSAVAGDSTDSTDSTVSTGSTAFSTLASPSKFRTVPLGGRLTLTLRGDSFYDRDEGIVNHDILSRIETSSDIAGSIREAVSAGELREEEAAERASYIANLLSSVESRHWFDGTCRVLNEVSIIGGDSSVHRPDRVMVEKGCPFGCGKAVVIDYKFGVPKECHAGQVRLYMELLSEMGYNDVSGAVWYCRTGTILDIQNI